jgi:cbb3-type cytochrome oxidase subunit 3
VIRNVLESISGIEFYPIISLLVLFSFFVFIITWVVKLDKKTISKLENMPLDDDDQSQNSGRN